jgi:hypothetical protein
MKTPARILASNAAYAARKTAQNPHWGAERKKSYRQRNRRKSNKYGRVYQRVRRAQLKGLILWAMIRGIASQRNGATPGN